MNNIEKVSDRFIRYAKVHTTSDHNSGKSPSTSCQFQLADLLYEEMQAMGISDVYYDRTHCYLYGHIPATDGSAESELPCGIGFLAHMDTSPDLTGLNVNPVIRPDYDGMDIDLGAGYTMTTREFPELLDHVGQTLITTDGTTLLGSDDKAGVAEIMTLAQYLLNHPEIPHPRIAIGFTPDEEIGEGTDYFDIKMFGARYAYTVDGGALGELEYENFNAASATVTFKGRNVHPGYAKGKMINSLQVGLEFHGMLPIDARPECTEGYQGFFHLMEANGSVEESSISYIIRDHDSALFDTKKNMLYRIAKDLNSIYGPGTVTVSVKDSYFNMKEKIAPVMFLVDNARNAMEKTGIKPLIVPVRGGTDGARLSYEGLPTPNLCTGGHNFHGRFEFISVESMEAVVRMLIQLVQEDFSG